MASPPAGRPIAGTACKDNFGWRSAKQHRTQRVISLSMAATCPEACAIRPCLRYPLGPLRAAKHPSARILQSLQPTSGISFFAAAHKYSRSNLQPQKQCRPRKINDSFKQVKESTAHQDSQTNPVLNLKQKASRNHATGHNHRSRLKGWAQMPVTNISNQSPIHEPVPAFSTKEHTDKMRP